MKVLYVATKCPWPTVDGGRLLMARTIRGLCAAGHRVTLVFPSAVPVIDAAAPEGCTVRRVPARPRPLPVSLVLSLLRRRAVSTVRHALPAVRREVERLLDTEAFDVVHAEQLQALAQAEPAFERGVPVVLRAQNVESDLWSATAKARRFFGQVAAREARRLARDEAAAVGRATVTVALTSEDAACLGELQPHGRIEVVRAPFPSALPPAAAALEGEPAVVLLGSEGWLPNRDAVDWFLGSIWPALRRVVPAAQLHLFGNVRQEAAAGVRVHPPPPDSRDVFAPGSVMVVPLRIASGVRMKILEAWARGVPVVASPQAARGLAAEDGRELLEAPDVEGFVEAVRRLHEERGLAERIVEAGRESLVERHDPDVLTAELVRIYLSVTPGSEALHQPEGRPSR